MFLWFFTPFVCICVCVFVYVWVSEWVSESWVIQLESGTYPISGAGIAYWIHLWPLRYTFRSWDALCWHIISVVLDCVWGGGASTSLPLKRRNYRHAAHMIITQDRATYVYQHLKLHSLFRDTVHQSQVKHMGCFLSRDSSMMFTYRVMSDS